MNTCYKRNIYKFMVQELKVDYYKYYYKNTILFPTRHSADLTDVLKINDITLRNVALFLTEHFKNARILHTSLGKETEYCKHLNNWLDQKKMFYTSAGSCSKNNALWQQYIEELWTKLEQSEHEETWCKREPTRINGSFPQDWIPSTCTITASEGPNSPAIDGEVGTDSTPTSFVVTLLMGYVFLGILFICFCLYKFTPLGSLLLNYIKKKKKIWNNLSEIGNQKIFRNSPENNNSYSESGLNHIFYHSSMN
ncbi:PIR Superfamily Protein [Plasmodium ovale wallikeri]|uniref:PIR Superfamily Protein n=1 Tax=Plasmodium ovale wallikeri TaxID=864142 RepID=A0A1A9AID7_PLAOA|nr:PIR Superfamily Protein [Plasmodium ovale wallikeri]